MKKTTPQRKKTASNAAAPGRPEEHPESLEKVRDILFGGQMRAVDSRLAALEERFQRDLEAVRSDSHKRISDLEASFTRDLQTQAEQIKTERAKRGDDLKQLGNYLRASIRDLEKAVARLDDSTSKADADLRTAVLEHSKTVTADLKRLSEETSKGLERITHELRSEKLDTASLIELFSDMALRLTEDLQAPPASA
ncbi:MAG: hypothetical protein JSW71_00990 [Gemmatimonadota bacterium]|nr:MAG: hypothetical protein JSW71_00990 [Gemmatimonadota bacterium]